MTTISGRVRTAMRSVAIQQKQLAERVGMTPDALSRALSGQRGFAAVELAAIAAELDAEDRKSTRLNSSHVAISYAVFCLKKKNNNNIPTIQEHLRDELRDII